MKGIHETLRRRRNSLRERFSHRRQRSSSRSHETESSWRETGAPKLLLTANALYFDHTLFQDFREEGYDIAYLPHAAPPKQYKEQLQRFADVLEEEDRYAIVDTDSSFMDSLWGSRFGCPRCLHVANAETMRCRRILSYHHSSCRLWLPIFSKLPNSSRRVAALLW
ncbi:hypothetical protein CIHG_01218 [Coccidioides immitis H538.4]|uniref:Uncharacterized protein n=1 Tax=Coccidioides immitis H538.4 TaxID=396776 RepID=A0A0J8RFP2_COCIT|nr:hypothetical protein CIHG_01218 [Coccidioides immitis H538.4]